MTHIMLIRCVCAHGRWWHKQHARMCGRTPLPVQRLQRRLGQNTMGIRGVDSLVQNSWDPVFESQQCGVLVPLQGWPLAHLFAAAVDALHANPSYACDQLAAAGYSQLSHSESAPRPCGKWSSRARVHTQERENETTAGQKRRRAHVSIQIRVCGRRGKIGGMCMRVCAFCVFVIGEGVGELGRASAHTVSSTACCKVAAHVQGNGCWSLVLECGFKGDAQPFLGAVGETVVCMAHQTSNALHVRESRGHPIFHQRFTISISPLSQELGGKRVLHPGARVY